MFLVQFDQQFDQLVGIGLVEGASRLVGEKKPRLIDQGPGNRDALLLATRYFCRPMMEAMGQADFVQQLFGSLAKGFAREAAMPRKGGNHDILQHGALGQKMVGLEDEPDGAVAEGSGTLGRKSGNVIPVHQNFAAAWLVESADDVQGRGELSER